MPLSPGQARNYLSNSSQLHDIHQTLQTQINLLENCYDFIHIHLNGHCVVPDVSTGTFSVALDT